MQTYVGGSTAGTGYGQLAVHSKATLAGSLEATVASGFAPVLGESLPIISFASSSGTFSAIKSLSGEQFLDNLMQAIGHDEPLDGAAKWNDNPLRRRVLAIFSGPGITGDPETLRGTGPQRDELAHSFSEPSRPPRAGGSKSTLEEFPDSPERQIEALYLATLVACPPPTNAVAA